MCTSHVVTNNTANDDPRSGYRLVEGWPHYPPGMQFEKGSGVAVDKDGIIYARTIPSDDQSHCGKLSVSHRQHAEDSRP